MENYFQSNLLFDYTVGHFVKKSDLSEKCKKRYQDQAEAHLKMMHERLKIYKNDFTQST